MPPKTTITPELVLEAGFQLVRREGLQSLSARRVAQELGCSTQPIYSAFETMEQCKQEIIQRAGAVAMSYLAPAQPAERSFLQVGLGSLRFAQDEPQLWRLINQSGIVLKDLQRGHLPPGPILEQMRGDPLLAELSDEQLTRIHTLLWFFSQGVSTLLFTETENAMSLAEEYLMRAGQAVIGFELNRRDK